MPRVPEGFDWDLDMPGSRFTGRPAIAIGFPEEEWYDRDAARAAFARHVGEWVFEEQDKLGKGDVVDSTVGRGASGIAAALEFALPYALGGMISASAGAAWLAFLRKVRAARQPEGERERRFLVSRGAAAYAAAGAVVEEFGEQDELVVEAVEEPSAIAGHDVSELSYTGIEPWVVLLRRDQTLRRYVVVVAPDGEIDGLIETPMREWEPGYLLPPERDGA